MSEFVLEKMRNLIDSILMEKYKKRIELDFISVKGFVEDAE